MKGSLTNQISNYMKKFVIRESRKQKCDYITSQTFISTVFHHHLNKITFGCFLFHFSPPGRVEFKGNEEQTDRGHGEIMLRRAHSEAEPVEIKFDF